MNFADKWWKTFLMNYCDEYFYTNQQLNGMKLS